MSLAFPENFSRDEVLHPLPAYGQPELEADFKSQPADFEVEEIPLLQPDGQGEHLWLWVEKHAANTHWVATELARCAGISARAVSWAGLKDRHSVSRQYFSMQLPGKADPDWRQWQIEGVNILQARRHSRKLKIGALKGNKFKIILRHCRPLEADVDFTAAQASTNTRLEKILSRGVPNYFGSQRFGRDGSNLLRAASWLGGRKLGKRARKLRSLLISTVRSCLFNQVLAARVEAKNWDQALEGEWLQLDGSRSGFLYEPEGQGQDKRGQDIATRLHAFDLHPSGPLVGDQGKADNDKMPRAEALIFEQKILADWQAWITALAAQRVNAERRALRLLPKHLKWHWQQKDCHIAFELPAGSYATVVLNQAFKLIEQQHQNKAQHSEQGNHEQISN